MYNNYLLFIFIFFSTYELCNSDLKLIFYATMHIDASVCRLKGV